MLIMFNSPHFCFDVVVCSCIDVKHVFTYTQVLCVYMNKVITTIIYAFVNL